MLSLPARRYFFRAPPRASQLALPSSIVVLPVTAVAAVFDLATTYVQVPSQANSSSFGDGGIGGMAGFAGNGGVRLCLQAVGVTVGIIVGNVVGDVTGANAPSLAAAGAVTAAGVYTSALGTCWQLIPGQPSAILEFEPAPTQDVFVGFIGSGNGTLLVYQCSGANA